LNNFIYNTLLSSQWPFRGRIIKICNYEKQTNYVIRVQHIFFQHIAFNVITIINNNNNNNINTNIISVTSENIRKEFDTQCTVVYQCHSIHTHTLNTVRYRIWWGLTFHELFVKQKHKKILWNHGFVSECSTTHQSMGQNEILSYRPNLQRTGKTQLGTHLNWIGWYDFAAQLLS